VDLADIHGQFKFNFEHAAITRDDSKKILDWAFWHDFERNGPSLYRICRTTFEGWKRYKNHPDWRIRERFEREIAMARRAYGGLLWAMEKHIKKTNLAIYQKIRPLRQEMAKEFGLRSRLAAAFLGPLFLWTAWREERRLARGQTYEGATAPFPTPSG
jgi:hypothetical protein